MSKKVFLIFLINHLIHSFNLCLRVYWWILIVGVNFCSIKFVRGIMDHPYFESLNQQFRYVLVILLFGVLNSFYELKVSAHL